VPAMENTTGLIKASIQQTWDAWLSPNQVAPSYCI
jgi:hypothetical protein